MADNFDPIERLGSGYFGEVWRVRETGLNAEYAVKYISPSKVIDKENLFQEAQILNRVQHANVVIVKETGTTQDGRIYVAMEYLPKGSLEDEAHGAYVHLTRAKRIMIDVLRGLEHAHSMAILHRDIKPANILVGNNEEGKLSDFGLAIPMYVDIQKMGLRDYAYIYHAAPEILKNGLYSVASDLYACGVTLYRLVNGDSYLPAVSPEDLRNACIRGDFPNRALYREFITIPLRRLINRSIDPDPERRYPSATAMRRALEQIVIEKNWQERRKSNGGEWLCSWNNRCYEVMLAQQPCGSWSVIVKKGKDKHSLRAISALCREDLTLQRAKQVLRRILQDYVLGKLK